MDKQACWNQIGVEGDRSCERLQQVRHCCNCDVYIQEGRCLLEREVPLDYLQEWTIALAQENAAPWGQASLKVGQAQETLSVMIFRLGTERLALPVRILQEITTPSEIHTLPHRSTELFLGLVNIRGEILPCVSLSHLLGVETTIDPSYSRINLRRMMVIGLPDHRWVFPVDEVYCVHRCPFSELREPPVVIVKAAQAYTQGIIDWRNEKVNYLNADLLLDMLERRIL